MKTVETKNGIVECFRDEDLQSPTFQGIVKSVALAWSKMCEQYVEKHGDFGTAVIGAGIAVWYLGPKCRRPEEKLIISRHQIGGWQAEEIWLGSVRQVLQMLQDNGISAHYKAGSLG